MKCAKHLIEGAALEEKMTCACSQSISQLIRINAVNDYNYGRVNLLDLPNQAETA
ncbi:MAG: hypothetical protein NVSMB3_11120 [Acidobacteriaceae bacterium]